MDTIQVISGKGEEIRPDKNTVLQLLHCHEDSPVYKEFAKGYEKLLPRVKERLRPAAAFRTGMLPDDISSGALPQNARILYCIMTIGREVSDYSDYYFKRGDYVKGMMVDAIADACLFRYEEDVLEQIRKHCMDLHQGISHRYEAPQDIPMEIQKTAFDILNASKSLGLTITSGFMYQPVKSVCQIFELSDREDLFVLEHDCSRCERKDCAMRHHEMPLEVTIKGTADERVVYGESGKNLLQILLNNQIYINAVCGGNGKCRKCRIRVLEGKINISEEDRKSFSEEELSMGMRLACCARPSENCTIEICQEDESDFHVVGIKSGEVNENGRMTGDLHQCGIAIDIGTTTLALSLLDLERGRVLDTYTTMNHQRKFGADVITRMQAACSGQETMLQESIRKDLKTGISDLLKKNKLTSEKLKKIAVAGNTTMLHLLMGYSCEGLGIYPFTPVTLKLEKRKFSEVFGTTEIPDETEVFLLPGNSTYVGADIMSGLYSCGFHKNEKICVLIDLGTNGEMAVGNKDKIMVTSTAAGPAFEGGNIEWGVGSIAGAVCGVQIENNQALITTIEDKPPAGICGTGVIETMAELVRNNLVDETGVLEEEYFENGFPIAQNAEGKTIVFTQKDVREIQLAKSAVRAGLETLLLRYGVTKEQIDQVYLAGGFGYYLKIDKAVQIGMLPAELEQKTIAVGNTSLSGAVQFLLHEEEAKSILTELAEKGEEIQLSSDRNFNDLYMDNMMFGDL